SVEDVEGRGHPVREAAGVDRLRLEVEERGPESEAAIVLAATAGVGVHAILVLEAFCAERFHRRVLAATSRRRFMGFSFRAQGARRHGRNSENGRAMLRYRG